ncbi:hypothetical protein B0O80DRAFT_47986 [Mortierella sp. GBAus27b]|nr:hypothetical protein B0O80DRAFT_47986 [Mortierella sp. GBAus27b]
MRPGKRGGLVRKAGIRRPAACPPLEGYSRGDDWGSAPSCATSTGVSSDCPTPASFIEVFSRSSRRMACCKIFLISTSSSPSVLFLPATAGALGGLPSFRASVAVMLPPEFLLSLSALASEVVATVGLASMVSATIVLGQRDEAEKA